MWWHEDWSQRSRPRPTRHKGPKGSGATVAASPYGLSCIEMSVSSMSSVASSRTISMIKSGHADLPRPSRASQAAASKVASIARYIDAFAFPGDDTTRWRALRKAGVELDLTEAVRGASIADARTFAIVAAQATPLVAFALLACFDAISDTDGSERGGDMHYLGRLFAVWTPSLFGSAARAPCLHRWLTQLATAFGLRSSLSSDAYVMKFPVVARFGRCVPPMRLRACANAHIYLHDTIVIATVRLREPSYRNATESSAFADADAAAASLGDDTVLRDEDARGVSRAMRFSRELVDLLRQDVSVAAATFCMAVSATLRMESKSADVCVEIVRALLIVVETSREDSAVAFCDLVSPTVPAIFARVSLDPCSCRDEALAETVRALKRTAAWNSLGPAIVECRAYAGLVWRVEGAKDADWGADAISTSREACVRSIQRDLRSGDLEAAAVSFSNAAGPALSDRFGRALSMSLLDVFVDGRGSETDTCPMWRRVAMDLVPKLAKRVADEECRCFANRLDGALDILRATPDPMGVLVKIADTIGVLRALGVHY